MGRHCFFIISILKEFDTDTIVGKRQSGKTTELIITAYDTGATIIVCVNAEREQIKNKAKEMGLNPDCLHILTVREIIAGKARGMLLSGVIIDNGEDVFQMIFDHYLGLNVRNFTIQYVTPSRTVLSRITKGSDYD